MPKILLHFWGKIPEDYSHQSIVSGYLNSNKIKLIYNLQKNKKNREYLAKTLFCWSFSLKTDSDKTSELGLIYPEQFSGPIFAICGLNDPNLNPGKTSRAEILST